MMRLRRINHVSIHAPAGGATFESLINCGLPDVSIHAPAGGATVTIVTSYNLNKINCQRAILFVIFYFVRREILKSRKLYDYRILQSCEPFDLEIRNQSDCGTNFLIF